MFQVWIAFSLRQNVLQGNSYVLSKVQLVDSAATKLELGLSRTKSLTLLKKVRTKPSNVVIFVTC